MIGTTQMEINKLRGQLADRHRRMVSLLISE